ncbi:cyclodeaminase/cyclohydrolase family protein [Haloactinopolyspora sp.]|jgi:formiminotetrahydrofolate cyclodeaminase|uniref:cyclodeaminase/cyclohydrolase family protein n=1 Tax=Haloactinopolyspora sp. TaxID=1966353 RepID=UPI00261F7893|nr:cyclodeaminase/cyclohydrolase family protein [Haloactinopolyspora sp.]
MSAPGWQRGDYLDRPLRDLLDDAAGHDPLPAAGSIAAATAALAAALTVKVARRSAAHRPDTDDLVAHGEKLLARLSLQISADPPAYAAYLRDRSPQALRAASSAPAEVAKAGAEVATLAGDLAATGNPALAYDAAAAQRLATAATTVAESLIAANDPREDS